MDIPYNDGESAQVRLLTTELQASEARLRSIVDRSPDAFLVIGQSGAIRFVNPAASCMFGVDAARLLGRPFGFPLTEGEMTDIDIFNPHSGGLVAEMRVVDTDWGGEKAYIAVLRDITQRKAAEAEIQRLNAELEQRVLERTAELERSREALLRSNAELERFAHVAAHDLQAPLRSIAGFAQLLREELGSPRDARSEEWLGYIIDSTRRLQNLISDLLAYTRLDSQARPFEPVDLRRLVGEVVASLSALIEGAHAKVDCGELPTLMADPIAMGQLFQNLIENSLKYNRSEHPRVSIDAHRGDGEWEISVADNGIGIAPQDHQRIFEIFRRLHAYSQVPGTGIGLATCQRIVQRHGGRIWVESEPGRGSIFRFTLPDK